MQIPRPGLFPLWFHVTMAFGGNAQLAARVPGPGTEGFLEAHEWAASRDEKGRALGEPFRGSQLESLLLLVPDVERVPGKENSVVMEGGKGWPPKAGSWSLGLRRKATGQDYFFQL